MRDVPALRMFGNTPVPWTVSWSSEMPIAIGRCEFAGGTALVQPSSPGIGQPMFGKPHSCRQRECIARDLCDLCGRPLKNTTKVSLSHARSRMNGAEPLDVLQVEPLLHKKCALLSIQFCPSLRRDLKSGSIMVRQVNRHRVQFAIMSAEYCGQVADKAVKAFGHAKVQLLRWIDRDLAWLEATA